LVRHAGPVIACGTDAPYRRRQELLDITITFKLKVKLESFKRRWKPVRHTEAKTH